MEPTMRPPPAQTGQAQTFEPNILSELAKEPLEVQVARLLVEADVPAAVNANRGPPQRRILRDSDMPQWLASEAYVKLVVFVQALALSVVDKPNGAAETPPDGSGVARVAQMLDAIAKLVDETEPDEGPRRFGNRAFARVVALLERDGRALLAAVLGSSADSWPEDVRAAVLDELLAQLLQSFGHPTRLDYGSGHELAFAALLLILHLAGIVGPRDHRALVLVVFNRYLELCRRIQRRYNLEPAGSHGVWGLDDHQFLPYYFGAAQLLAHKRLRPRSILSAEIVDHFARDYMFLRCIQYIHEVKTGPFHEHSPMLYDISGVPTWQKVATGMLKMYNAEVLQKFPVVQHVTFGPLFRFNRFARDAGGDTGAENG